MAKAKKLPSGMWRVLVYSHTEIVDGKPKRKYKSFTAADKRAAELMAAEYKAGKEPQEKNGRENLTLIDAIDKYIAAKSNVLSPTTVNGYAKIKKYAFPELMNRGIYDLKKADIQAAVNKESCRKATRKSGTISAKTVRNEYGLLTAVFGFYDISFGNIALPKSPEKFVELPPAKEVIAAIAGTSIELPCLLACWLSFSMSEILGIRCGSIRNGVLYIENVRVKVGNEEIDKSTGKAEKRIRAHAVPPYIMQLIEQQDTYKEYKRTGENCYLIPLTGNALYERFKYRINKAGYSMTFHQLRHLNASVMALLNVPEKYAMERGGWKTPQTMKKVYQHTFSEERLRVDGVINDYFESIISDEMQHEIQHKEKER
jgi:integrase